MKISGIDKDFEDIIYYLDAKGYKPFSSCDGVEANHKRPEEVNDAYIAFLKSPKIIDLMAAFLKDEEKFRITLKSEDHMKPWELYGNTISGNTYQVCFSNKTNENTTYFKNIIKSIVEEKENVSNNEKKKLEMLDKILGENSDSDLAFQVTFNGNYAPYTNKAGKINELVISTKAGEEKIEGNVAIRTERNMEVLADILSKKYHMSHRTDKVWEEYPETEFITAECDKTSCTIYFTDEHFMQMLEKIKYIREISHTLPTFEGREWIGSDEELLNEYYDEEHEIENLESQLAEEYMIDDFEVNNLEEQKTLLRQKEDKLFALEQEEKELLKEEKRIEEIKKAEDRNIRE